MNLTKFLHQFKIPTLSLMDSGALVMALMTANLLNFLYNAYLGRMIGFEEFGLISLIGSFLNLSHILLHSYSRTLTYRSGYLFGKYGRPVKELWQYFRAKSYRTSIALTLLWLAAIPLLQRFFNADQSLPFLLMTPVWFIGITAAVDSGYLSGAMKFRALALMILVEVISRLIFTVVLVELGYQDLIYAVIPLATVLSFLTGWIAVTKIKTAPVDIKLPSLHYFPWKFFVTSILSKTTIVVFLNLDILLAKHYLDPTQAGVYALLSLIGKMIFFLSVLFSQFVIPVVSQEEGAGRNSDYLLRTLVWCTSLVVGIGFLGVGVLGSYTVPFLLGEKALVITDYLFWYSLGMACFGISSIIVSFYQSKKMYGFSYVSFLLGIGVVLGIMTFHQTVGQINMVMSVGGILSLVVMVLMHYSYQHFAVLGMNFQDLKGLWFTPITPLKQKNKKLSILLFNWRDTRHIWAGGAEIYAHELAKRWVIEGHHVTVFCGNDGKNPRNEVMDGVQVIRRGGFYTVYIWAFLYYVFRFRSRYHCVIDCENGIPFFTPFFVEVPVFLLIHHVHQHVFRDNLVRVNPVLLPLVWTAALLEGKVMPWLYQGSTILTVSQSSQMDIAALGMGKPEDIMVVNPGIDLTTFRPMSKAQYPSLLYIGRLKSYKNIDVILKAFSALYKTYPALRLSIAGSGESQTSLELLAKRLKISHAVRFWGRVTELQKTRLLAKSWIVLQPSSFEGWGLTVIEANACKTTVIASDVNGLRDSVIDGKTGILVTVNSVEKLRKAIQKLITDKKYLQQLNEQAYEWSQTFSWETSAQQFMQVIKKSLSVRSDKQLLGRFVPAERGSL